MLQRPLVYRLAAVARRPGLWLLVGLFLFVTFLEYAQLLRQTFLINLGLTRYTLERTLYLLPIIWAAFMFGWKGGTGASLCAVASMLPRAILSSPNREDSLIEIFFVFAIGNLASYWVGALHSEKEHAAELREAQGELQYLLHQVTQAQEEERKRIAQELHDDTIQSLVALCQQIDFTISSVGQLPPQAVSHLEELHQQTDHILQEVRRLVRGLRPAVLDNLGLVSALEWLASDVEKHSGIAVKLRINGSERRFSTEAELVLFRIAQEALTNVWKHSQAKSAQITLEFSKGSTSLIVSDDGKGFDSTAEVITRPRLGKLGLAGMQERARLLGGTLTVISEPGKGTIATATMPL